MKIVGPRTYEVKAADFPIAVLVEAQNEPACRAIASDLQVVKDGALAETIPVNAIDNPANLSTSYAIPRPRTAVPCDIVSVLHCWFDDKAPDTAAYKITITAQSGDTATTKVGVPTVNPGMANLVFRSR